MRNILRLGAMLFASALLIFSAQSVAAAREKCVKGDRKCISGMVHSCFAGRWAKTNWTCGQAESPHLCPSDGTRPEQCNGIDDDCNGVTDDMGTITCGQGICRRDVPVCSEGRFGLCRPGPRRLETCNGLDDDCDGLVDEDLGFMRCGVGGCARGGPWCVNGQRTNCVPGSPSPEDCNGSDDDCDGKIDEELPALVCTGECWLATDLASSCVDGVPQKCTPTAIRTACHGIGTCENLPWFGGSDLHRQNYCDGQGACLDRGTVHCFLRNCISWSCEVAFRCESDGDCSDGYYCFEGECVGRT